MIDKDTAFNILDRIIGFINNCDNKASVVLGFWGIALVILFTNEGITNLKNIILTIFEFNLFTATIFFALFLCFSVVFVIGIIMLISVLFAKTDHGTEEELEWDSKIYYGDIKKKTYKQYKEKMVSSSEEELLNDIISQIHINSHICSNKFLRYNQGIKLSFIGFIGFIALWFIGNFIF